MLKKFLVVLMSLSMIFLTGCGAGGDEKKAGDDTAAKVETGDADKGKTSDESKVAKPDGKALIVYYSRTGDNYEVGVIEKGNTRIVADMIKDKIPGADVFEIKPVKDYPADYRECTEVAKAEKESDARPEIAGKVENFEQYDTIFIGYPNWWSDMPMLMYTFLESYDFNGKTIVPFCTSSSDYFIGKEELQKYAKGSTVLDGLGVRGKRCQENPEDVRKEVNAWLEKSGF